MTVRTEEQTFPPPYVAWTMVGILTLLYSIAYLDRAIISLLVEPIRKDLGLSDLQIGLLQGFAFAFFYAVLGLPLGALVDRMSRRKVIFYGVTFWAIAASACGLARNFSQLFLARLGVGAGEAALAPAAYSMIADSFPKHRITTASAVFSTGTCIGAAASIALGGYLIGYAVAHGDITLPLVGTLRPWQFVFFVTGLPGLLFGFCVFLFPEPARHKSPDLGDKPALWPFMSANRKLFTNHFLGFAALQAVAMSSAFWTPAYLVRRFAMPLESIGLIMGAISMFSIIGMVSGGWLVDRWFKGGRTDAHTRFFLVVGPLLAILIGVSMMMPTAAGFLVVNVLVVCLIPSTAIASASLQLVVPGELRGRVIALFTFVINLFGQSIGALLPGFFSDLVFHDPAMIGWGIFLSVLTTTPVAVWFLFRACGPMRSAITGQGR